MLLLVGGIIALPWAARAGTEDAAIFYEELTQYGNWVDYEEYGPVWYPTQVEEDWRPYVNGRWVPTKHGYIFETEEPWGWATYHYGNWMPTEVYGWVWVPGRTWYPSTVTWRNTPETAVGTAVDAAYIGWAPIPPPNYVPPPNTGWYPPGWGPGQPILNVLTAPFWIFSQAASFLLGLGQPFTPAYTYVGCGCLAPPAYYPVVYPVTRIISNWYYPTYYPPTYFAGGAIPGAYNWGPPVQYLTRVTNINNTVINNYIDNYNVTNIRNGYPPDIVFAKHQDVMPHITPPREFHNWGNPMRVQNVNALLNRNQIANPGAIAKPAGLPNFDRSRLPKAERHLLADPKGAFGPGSGGSAWEGRTHGTKGLGISQKAVRPITPDMERRLQTAKPIKGAEAFTGMGGRGLGQGQPGISGRGPGLGAVEGQPGVGRGGDRGPGASLIGRGQQQGPGQGPGGGQPGIQRGLGGPGQPGIQRGPGEGPGVRRGPGEGLMQPPGQGRGPGGPAQGIGRGPGEGQPGLGVSRGRGPGGEGFQPPGQPGGQPGIRRGPTGSMEGMPGVRQGPGEGPGVRRGPGQGLMQPPGQGRGPGGTGVPGQPGIQRSPGGPGQPGSQRGPGAPGPGIQRGPGGAGQPGIQRGPGGMPPGSPPAGGAPNIRQQSPPGPPPGSQGMRGPGGGAGTPHISRGAGGGAPPQIQRSPGGGAPPQMQRGPGGGAPPQMQRGPGGGAPPQVQKAPSRSASPPPQQSSGGGGGGQKQQQQGKRPFPPQ